MKHIGKLSIGCFLLTHVAYATVAQHTHKNVIYNSMHKEEQSSSQELFGADTPMVQDQKKPAITQVQTVALPPVDENFSTLLTQPNVEQNDKIYFNFDNVDLKNVADFVAKIHQVTFITPDIVTGQAAAQGAPVAGPNQAQTQGFSGHKVSYRSHVPLSKKESWNLFLTFLHMAGFALEPMADPSYFQVVTASAGVTGVLPTFIGTHPDALPDNDMLIRYIYFMENLDPAVLKPLIAKLQNNKTSVEVYSDLRALLFVDKARNIKSLMKIVKELDRATLPQAMSVLKLKRANAEDVKKLYNSLRASGSTDQANQRAWMPQYKESSLQYFPKEALLSSEPRTNSLIILGPKDAVKRIEDFIIKYIDVELDAKSMPIYTYQLQYTNAADVKASLDGVLSYSASNPTAAQFGGVRDGYKFLQGVTIVADSYSNSLIINAYPDDYEIVQDLIKTLDRPQKQVAIELLIVNVSHTRGKQLGSQLSMPETNNTLFGNVAAQTSGVGGSGIVYSAANGIRQGLNTLLGSSAVNTAGSTLVTFGQPIWAILKVAQTMSATKILTSQFMLTSNNYAATFETGQSRQVQTAAVANGSNAGTITGYDTVNASLAVTITPQVNEQNMITLYIDIKDADFIDKNAGSNSGNSMDKVIKTTATIANGEVLALGGILTDSDDVNQNGVPFLEKIPFIGWLFKSKARGKTKASYLVFISAKVLDENIDAQDMQGFTKTKVDDAQRYINLAQEFESGKDNKDPIDQAFFDEKHTADLSTKNIIDNNELIGTSAYHKKMQEARVKIEVHEEKKATRKQRRMQKQQAKVAAKKNKKFVKAKETKETVMVQHMHVPKDAVLQDESVLLKQQVQGLYYD